MKKDEPDFLIDKAPGATGRDRLSDEERRKIGTLCVELSGGFVWSDSPQGYQFWSLVHRELQRNWERYYFRGDKDVEP